MKFLIGAIITVLFSTGCIKNNKTTTHKEPTKLYVAVINDDFLTAQSLLEAGANPNEKNNYMSLGRVIATGYTPIFVARNVKMLNLLLKHKANINAVESEGNTALYPQRKDMVSPLLLAGINPFIRNYDNKTVIDVLNDFNRLGLGNFQDRIDIIESFINAPENRSKIVKLKEITPNVSTIPNEIKAKREKQAQERYAVQFFSASVSYKYPKIRVDIDTNEATKYFSDDKRNLLYKKREQARDKYLAAKKAERDARIAEQERNSIDWVNVLQTTTSVLNNSARSIQQQKQARQKTDIERAAKKIGVSGNGKAVTTGSNSSSKYVGQTQSGKVRNVGVSFDTSCQMEERAYMACMEKGQRNCGDLYKAVSACADEQARKRTNHGPSQAVQN